MPYVISICTSPRAEEKPWRTPLGTLSTIVNISQTGTIPNLSDLIKKCPKDQSPVLLITGGHGDVTTDIYNGATLEQWEKWIKAQPKGQFNLIVLDFCDSSSLVSAGIASLLTPSGTMISNIGTGHGLRNCLIENDFEAKEALPSYLNNSVDLLQGSNLSFTKREATTTLLHKLFCTEGLSKVYDERAPKSFDGDDEVQQRKTVLKKIHQRSKQSRPLSPPIKVSGHPDLVPLVAKLDRPLKPKLCKKKISLFAGALALAGSAAFILTQGAPKKGS